MLDLLMFRKCLRRTQPLPQVVLTVSRSDANFSGKAMTGL